MATIEHSSMMSVSASTRRSPSTQVPSSKSNHPAIARARWIVIASTPIPTSRSAAFPVGVSANAGATQLERLRSTSRAGPSGTGKSTLLAPLIAARRGEEADRFDKSERRVELTATVSEAVADAVEKAKALQTEGSAST